MNQQRLQEEMDRAVKTGVFPGGVLLLAQGDRIACHVAAGRLTWSPQSPPVTRDTIYDLASLTKILSTTLLTMILIDQGRLELQTPLTQIWPNQVPPDKTKITLAHLLSHTSGLPAWRPYYETWEKLPPKDRRNNAVQTILAEPLQGSPGTQATYSDLNFILLGLALEKPTQTRQDKLFQDLVAAPLSLKNLTYRPLDHSYPDRPELIAPTEDVPRRGGILTGQVHDDNAAALTGVAGHAGLFGLAREVWRITNDLRRAYKNEPPPHLVTPQTVQTFWQAPPMAQYSTWAYGFDRPSPENSSAGNLLSKKSLGHLGYTGTSLWHDPESDLTIILLTNRVHPTAENQAIQKFRPRIHDVVVKACG